MKTWRLLLGKEAKFSGYRKTGVWGLHYLNSRYHWFGLKGVINLRRDIIDL